MQYIQKRQENILHLSKVAPKKFRRHILTRKLNIIIKLLYMTGTRILKSFMNPQMSYINLKLYSQRNNKF